MGSPVVRERDGAIDAALGLAATPAEQKPGIAAPVEQDHGLRASLERRIHLFLQPARDRHLKLRPAELLAHVHDFHARQLAAADPFPERR